MISNQFKTRNKHERIRCPECNSSSHILYSLPFGVQKRECKQGHIFYYSYLAEAIYNFALNYRIKL